MSNKTAKTNDNILYIIAYLFTIISGIIIYFLFSNKNKRMKMHSEQAIILGVIMLVADAILFLIPYIDSIVVLLIWLYGLYIGIEAYSGKDIDIPYITDFVKKNGM
jgi:uncharacterized membrane protein